MFHRLWTLKESYVKALGLGLSCPFDSFGISLGQTGPKLVAGPVTENIRLLEIDAGATYRSSLCIVGEATEVTVNTIDFNDVRLSSSCP